MLTKLTKEVEHGVKFLPRKSIVKSLPVRVESMNNIPAHDGKYYRKNNKVSPKNFNKTKVTGFKENIGVQPYGVDNTEYDAPGVPVQPPIYRPIDQQHMPGYALRGDQPPAPVEAPFYIPEQRIVHFDLKGAPPRLEYFLRMLKWVKDAGATGVLIEYEDMFPFSGKLERVSATNHYNVSDIVNIVNTCQQLGLDVIPLIQVSIRPTFKRNAPKN